MKLLFRYITSFLMITLTVPLWVSGFCLGVVIRPFLVGLEDGSDVGKRYLTKIARYIQGK